MSAQPNYINFAKYLVLEEASEEKHEYHQGKIIPMSGTSLNHNRIVKYLCIALENCLQKQGRGEVFMSDIKLRVEAYDKSLYPDLMVFMDDLLYFDKKHCIVTNPTLIVEVLSHSTADYDQGEKFRAYRSLHSFQEYLLIDQYHPHIDHYIKTAPSEWILREYEDLETSVSLSSLTCTLKLSTIYRNVEFPPPDTEKIQ